MKEVLSQHSEVAVPQFIALDSENLEAFVSKQGFPLVLKPASDQGSAGVSFFENKAQFQSALAKILPAERNKWNLEQKINDPVIHIDFLIRDSKIQYLSAAKYLVTAYEFYQLKKPVGTAMFTNEKELALFKDFADRVISTLGAEDGVFHLEAFYNSNSSKLTFLEIAARPGGALVAETIQLAHNMNIIQEHYLAQLNEPSLWMAKNSAGLLYGDTHSAGGQIMVPTKDCKGPFDVEFTQNPNAISLAITSIKLPNNEGKSNAQYRANRFGGMSAEFLFRGNSFEQVSKDVLATIGSLSSKCRW
jgi:D-ala D-ala ligase C-terminus